MKLFQKLTTLLVPKKAEFAKRLAAKRLACASSPLFASIATSGTTEYQLRVLGLESIEYAFTPESTVVNILEQYWKPHLRFMYSGPLDLPSFASEETRIAAEKKRLKVLLVALSICSRRKLTLQFIFPNSVHWPNTCDIASAQSTRATLTSVRKTASRTSSSRMQSKNHASSLVAKRGPTLAGADGLSTLCHVLVPYGSAAQQDVAAAEKPLTKIGFVLTKQRR